MLAPDQLVDLYRSNRQETVLSIYLDADQHDFGDRDKWRIALKTAVSAQRTEAGDPSEFDRAYERLRKFLDANENGFLSGRGWVGFATAEELLHTESVPVPMPNLVRWEEGLRVAPYARALKQARPVIAVLIDSRRARLLRYRMGAMTQLDYQEADTYLGDLTDVNVAKRPTNRTGVRGKTATDAAHRFLEVERERLVGRVAEEVRSAAGQKGLVVLGGADRSVDALQKELSDLGNERLLSDAHLSFDLSEADLRESVETAASELSSGEQMRTVERLIDGARAGGDACLGDAETSRAVGEGRVDTLYVSDVFRRRDPDRVDHFEGAAFEQGADVVEVARDAGEALERAGEGIGAKLRYRIRT
jgi:hypothetical protein